MSKESFHIYQFYIKSLTYAKGIKAIQILSDHGWLAYNMDQWLLVIKPDVFSLQMIELGRDRRSAVLVREVHSMRKEKLKIWCPSSIQKQKESRELAVGVKREKYFKRKAIQQNTLAAFVPLTLNKNDLKSSSLYLNHLPLGRCSPAMSLWNVLWQKVVSYPSVTIENIVWHLPPFHVNICTLTPTRVQEFWTKKLHVML